MKNAKKTEGQNFLPSHSSREISHYRRLNLPAAIFRRVANPVEPFRFQFIQDNSLPAQFGNIRDGFGQQANLFEQLADGLADVCY